MMLRKIMRAAIAAALLCIATPRGAAAQSKPNADDLTGAWRGKVTFTSGMFTGLKDLEYMYVFNAGGTMTESSNYDGVPPVPPAYGVWRRTAARTYEARYEFFQTKSVSTSAELIKQNGWGPGGYGIIKQTITLSADSRSFTSKISVDMFDNAGKPISGGGSGTASGARISF